MWYVWYDFSCVINFHGSFYAFYIYVNYVNKLYAKYRGMYGGWNKKKCHVVHSMPHVFWLYEGSGRLYRERICMVFGFTEVRLDCMEISAHMFMITLRRLFQVWDSTESKASSLTFISKSIVMAHLSHKSPLNLCFKFYVKVICGNWPYEVRDKIRMCESTIFMNILLWIRMYDCLSDLISKPHEKVICRISSCDSPRNSLHIWIHIYM